MGAPGRRFVGFFGLAAVVAMGAGPLAAHGPGGHLEITEVAVDAGAETITITGDDFDFGHRLKVVLGEIGDITALCTPNFSSPQTIVCDFSTTGLPPAGDFLLTVSTGKGESQSDEYDLTIGAAGPPGPPGPPGSPGPSGVLGFYTRSAVATSTGTGDVETITAQALCDAGDVVSGGGFTHVLPDGPHSMPQDITNAPNGAGTGWVGLIERIMPAGSTLTVWARCADVTP